jgi:enoyl-[acyl-carrier protein] reductase I
MGLCDGKKGLVLGVANDRSIAWAIAETIMKEGGECGFTYLPDSPYEEKKKNQRRVERCLKPYEQAKFLLPLDVQSDREVKLTMREAHRRLGDFDFLLHSIAFADRRDLNRDTVKTSRDGFKLAMDVSVYSLIAATNAAMPYLSDRSAILTMSYFGGEKCVPGYNVMGICKAALEATVRYLAHDMGPRGCRVNALSAGPLKTLAGSAAGATEMLSLYENMSPLGRNITHEEVGRVGAFLLSDYSDGVTGETMHIDGGYNAMGSPGRLLDAVKAAQGKA